MAETKRQTLKVVSVGERKGIGSKGATKREFKALDGEGKTLVYQVFEELFDEHLVNGASVEADVQTDTRETDSGSFTNRRIVQIYKDGQPVKSKSQQGGKGQYQPRIDNSASIEAQTAFKGIVELMVAKILGVEDGLSKIALAWAKARLSAKEPPVAESKQPQPEIPPKQQTKEPEAKQPATQGGTMSWAAFWKRCGNLGLDKEIILRILKVSSLKTEWIEKGKTLEEALAILEARVQSTGGLDAAADKPTDPE